MIKEIKRCANGHYWVKGETCPFCGEKMNSTVEARDGDCISCGQLCPANAYGCNEPGPMFFSRMDEDK